MEEFEFIKPMKAKKVYTDHLQLLDNDLAWATGEKVDGYREQLHLGKMRNELFSSLGTSHILKVPQFQVVVKELAGTVLDCEGLSPTRLRDDNAACFKADPPNAIAWQKAYGWAFLLAFDILYYQGYCVMSMPFQERLPLLKASVEVLCSIAKMPIKQEHLVYEGKLAYYEMIVARELREGHEGVMLKELTAPYVPGKRGPYWLKVKRLENFIGTCIGFTPGCGKYEGLVGSIIFVGDAFEGTASGMDDPERVTMTMHPELYLGKKIHIQAQEKTRYGALISPQYKGLVKEED